MEAQKINPQSNMLERTVTEMKNSVKLFISAAKGESEELDKMLDSMLSQLDAESSTFTFTQLVNQFKKKRNQILISNEEASRQSRIELIHVIKEAAKKEISTTQVDMLNSLINTARNGEVNGQELLHSFGETLLTMSDDISLSRNKHAKVVDDEHQHIKQNQANVVASDIQTASRRLARELFYLSKKLCKSFPEDLKLKNILEQADSLKDKSNQFFSSLDLLQDLNKHVSDLIGKERVGTQEMLIDIQSKILDVFKHSSDLEESFEHSSENSSNLDNAMKSRLESLKRQAENSDSIEDMQAIIDDSIKSLSGAMEAFTERQKKIDQQNRSKIRSLNGELADAKKQIKTVQDKLENKEEETLVDELSQLGNRKGYLKAIRSSHELWKKEKQKLSLIVLDIDNFKTINDNYGHSVGDQIIRKIGSIIKESVSEESYIARYGGEEFVIVCNDNDLITSARLAEKIRQKIAKRKFRLREKNQSLSVSASFGVSEFTKQRKDVVAVFNAADKAMYEAKNTGRNRAVAAHNNKLVLITKES